MEQKESDYFLDEGSPSGNWIKKSKKLLRLDDQSIQKEAGNQPQIDKPKSFLNQTYDSKEAMIYLSAIKSLLPLMLEELKTPNYEAPSMKDALKIRLDYATEFAKAFAQKLGVDNPSNFEKSRFLAASIELSSKAGVNTYPASDAAAALASLLPKEDVELLAQTIDVQNGASASFKDQQRKEVQSQIKMCMAKGSTDIMRCIVNADKYKGNDYLALAVRRVNEIILNEVNQHVSIDFYNGTTYREMSYAVMNRYNSGIALAEVEINSQKRRQYAQWREDQSNSDYAKTSNQSFQFDIHSQTVFDKLKSNLKLAFESLDATVDLALRLDQKISLQQVADAKPQQVVEVKKEMAAVKSSKYNPTDPTNMDSATVDKKPIIQDKPKIPEKTSGSFFKPKPRGFTNVVSAQPFRGRDTKVVSQVEP